MSSLFGSSSNTNQSGTTSQNSIQNSNFNTNQNSAGTAPDWITKALQGITGNITDLAGQNPQSFVAGANPLLTQAGTTAGGLGAGDPHAFGAASDVTGYVMNANAPRTGAVQASPYIQQYMDPYQNDVINATDADLTHNEGLSRARDALSLAGSGAFGGSGAALTQSADNEALARTRASTLSGLRSAGYTQALGAAEQDAGRRQSANDLNAQLYGQNMDRALGAASQLGGLATTQDANTRANIDSQSGVGTTLRGIAQQQATAPLSLASWSSSTLPDLLRGLFGQSGTTSGVTNGTTNSTGTTTSNGTTSTNPSGMSDLGDIAAIASLFLSDRRLKRDVVKIGERPDGLGVYSYRYLSGVARYIGVMAQEVLNLKPEAVVTLPSGWLAVNYGAL